MGGPPDEELLQASIRALAHRGPDSSGMHREPNVGLAHTRLSLLDLSDRASQPFWDPSGRYCLVYNGEIYNFQELRERLRTQGAVFLTGSDTEVLLHSLVLNGVRPTLDVIEGMFAFGFYDTQTRTLVVARDRIGIKPLFIYEDDTKFVFASEMAAMRGWVNLQPNTLQIISFMLGFGGPTRDACFYDRVRIVPPGCVVTVQVGQRSQRDHYFRITDFIDSDQAAAFESMDDRKKVDRLDELLQESVQKMLVADTPVGALCSGGVDSSVLLAMAARSHGDLAIFHADVVGPSSEYDAALALSKHLGLDLKVTRVVDQDFIDMLPEVTAHYGHPFHYHPNSVPFLAVAKLVQEHGVKAVLTGEGSDECFLGYAGIAQEPFLQAYAKQVDRARRTVQAIPAVGKYLWMGSNESIGLVASMLNDFERDSEEEEIRAAWAAAGRDPSDWNIRTPIWLSYHLRTTLHRNDRLGMAASLESRFPFLDENVVRAAINLPHSAKIRFSPTTLEKTHPFLRDKWVLRKVADRYLPKQLSRRKKLGFPVDAYARTEIPQSYFEESFVRDFFQLSQNGLNHLMAGATQWMKVRLVLLEVWAQICLGWTSQESARQKLQQHLSVTPQ